MNMTREEYDAMPIEEKPMYVAMVKRGEQWVLHRVCTKGVFASPVGLNLALGDDEELAIFKLEYYGKPFSPFGCKEDVCECGGGRVD